MKLPSRILVPTDFSAASSRALAIAIDLARIGDGSVTLLHVLEPKAYAVGAPASAVLTADGPNRANAEKALFALVEEPAQGGARVGWLLRAGCAEEEILTVAEEQKVDLIVMATHHGKHAGDGLGSVAENVIRNGRRLTLVVPDAPSE